MKKTLLIFGILFCSVFLSISAQELSTQNKEVDKIVQKEVKTPPRCPRINRNSLILTATRDSRPAFYKLRMRFKDRRFADCRFALRQFFTYKDTPNGWVLIDRTPTTTNNRPVILRLSPNVRYKFQVEMYNLQGRSIGKSQEYHFYVPYPNPPTKCPQSPTGVNAIYSHTIRIGALTWNRVRGATGYVVATRRQKGSRRNNSLRWTSWSHYNVNTNRFQFHRSQVGDGKRQFMVRSRCRNTLGPWTWGSYAEIFIPKSSQESSDLQKPVDILEESSIYPNPNNGNFNIKFKNNEKVRSVTIYDMMGQPVFNKVYDDAKLKEDEYLLNGKLKNGMYKVIIQTDKGSESKTLLVK